MFVDLAKKKQLSSSLDLLGSNGHTTGEANARMSAPSSLHLLTCPWILLAAAWKFRSNVCALAKLPETPKGELICVAQVAGEQGLPDGWLKCLKVK